MNMGYVEVGPAGMQPEPAEQLVHASKVIEGTLAKLRNDIGFDPGLDDETYERIVAAGFNRATLPAAFALTALALAHHPINVRGVMYQAQAAGLYPDTSEPYVRQTERILLKLRRKGIVPWWWIVDSTRRRLKPSSWSGLADFAESAFESYRLDFWSRQPEYVEIFVEKDARVGVIEPVTDKYDVYLNVIRGQAPDGFIWNIAEQWKQIEKPIFVYYLGDHDPAGFSIERCLKRKLRAFYGKDFGWQRLAVTPYDFANASLKGFPVKAKAAGRKAYIAKYGDRCVELDAIAPETIRQRISKTIEQHINQVEWTLLLRQEELEKEVLQKTLVKMRRVA